MLELAFPEIADRPPNAGINEREYFLADVRIRPLGNREIRYASVKRGIDPAVIEIVPGVLHRRLFSAPLVDEGFQRRDRMLGLLVLGRSRFQARLRELKLRFRLTESLGVHL